MGTLHYAVVLNMWCTIMDAKRPPVAETAALAMVWQSSPKIEFSPGTNSTTTLCYITHCMQFCLIML